MLLDRAKSVSGVSPDMLFDTAALGTNYGVNSGMDASHLGIALVVTEGVTEGTLVTVASSICHSGGDPNPVVVPTCDPPVLGIYSFSLFLSSSNANALLSSLDYTKGVKAIC